MDLKFEQIENESRPAGAPKGRRPPPQCCGVAATLGLRIEQDTTPTGLWLRSQLQKSGEPSRPSATTPLGLFALALNTQRSRLPRQRWAVGYLPLWGNGRVSDSNDGIDQTGIGARVHSVVPAILPWSPRENRTCARDGRTGQLRVLNHSATLQLSAAEPQPKSWRVLADGGTR
jgi:hypothetical protein